MRPYVNNPDWPNRKTDGYGDVTEGGIVPGYANEFTVELDQRIVPNGTLSVTCSGDALTIVPWEVSPNSEQVAVSYDLPLLRFHHSREGGSLFVVYTAGGAVLSSARLTEIAEGGAVTSVNGQTGVVELEASDVGAAPTAHTHNASDINAGIVAAARGGTGVSTGLTQLNASNLNAGTVPDARLSSNVARRDAANTFAQPVTFNGGVVRKISAAGGGGVNTVQSGDGFVVLNPSQGNVTVNLNTNIFPVGYELWATVINTDLSSVNTITWDAGPGCIVHSPESYGQTWTLSAAKSNVAHRWFKIFKISYNTWSIDSGVFS